MGKIAQAGLALNFVFYTRDVRETKMINLPVQFGEANEKGLYSSLLPPQKKEIIQEMFTYTGRLREAVTWEGTHGFVYRRHLAALVFTNGSYCRSKAKFEFTGVVCEG